MIIAIVAVVAVLLLGGGITTAVLLHQSSGDGGSPLAGPSSEPTPAGTVYHKLPTCDAFSASVVNSLVPQGSKVTDEPDSSDDTYFESIECEWNNVDADTDADRDIDINVSAYSDDLKPPAEAAQDALSDNESQAKQLEGSTQDDITYGSVTPVSGLGAGAFDQSFTSKGDDFTHGGTELGMVTGNALVILAVDGDDSGQTKPMDADEANQAAEKLGKAVIDWLNACSNCAG